MPHATELIGKRRPHTLLHPRPAAIRPELYFPHGEKHDLYLYEVYSDLRLVAAPPVSIAAFGGEVDNWEWPQHKGDFAIYRVYTAPDGKPAKYSPENVPLHPGRILKISTEGFSSGDFTMVMGYPGRTNRYYSPEAAHRKALTENPVTSELQGGRMEIMNKWMNHSPEIRLIYADTYFGTANAQELYEGETKNYIRFRVDDIKNAEKDGGMVVNFLTDNDITGGTTKPSPKGRVWVGVRCRCSSEHKKGSAFPQISELCDQALHRRND